MAYPDELLEQARHLAAREPGAPREASLRRAVSSAYYAAFHLLVGEAVSLWTITEHRPQLARIFEHGRMHSASRRVASAKQSRYDGEDPVVVEHLGKLAGSFSRLHDERESADYDNGKQWSRTEVLALVESVEKAFQSMAAIRNPRIVNDYLLSLFVKERPK